MRCPHLDKARGQCALAAHANGLHRYNAVPDAGSKKTRQDQRRRQSNRLLADARKEIKVRSDGLCEAWKLGHGSITCKSEPHVGRHAHHVHPEDRKLRDLELRHRPARMLWLCSLAHVWSHAHVEEAGFLGILRPA